METKNTTNKTRHNHWLMIVCCAIPVILLVTLTYVFGLNKRYLYWFIILLCPALHYLMMRRVHKKDGKERCH